MERTESTVKTISGLSCCIPDEIQEYNEIVAFLEEVHKIDVTVYSPEDAGEVTPMVNRYVANPESYICVRNDAGELVGYMNFFPVESELRSRILSSRTPYALLDDGITAEQVAPFRKKDNFIFVLSLAILPEYQGTGAIRLMTDEFCAFLKRKHAIEHRRISALAACAVSEHGRKALRTLRFRPLHDVEGSPEKTIFLCDNSDSDNKMRAGDLSKLIHIGPDVYRPEPPEKTKSTYVENAFWRETDIEDTVTPVEKYMKTWTDDIYLYLPMTEHVDNGGTDIFFSEKSEECPYEAVDPDQPHKTLDPDYDFSIHELILEKFEDSILYECSSQSIRDMEVHYIGCYDFLHTIDKYTCGSSLDPVHDDLDAHVIPADDDSRRHPHDEYESVADVERRIRQTTISRFGLSKDLSDGNGNYSTASETEEIVVGLQKGYVFITSHRPTHMYVVNVFFPDYEYSSTQLEDQVSNNYIKIVDPRICQDPYTHPEDAAFIRLYDYLWEKYHLHKCGQEKIMLCMSNKPDPDVYRTEFENVLSAEVYNSSYQEFHVHSKNLKELCKTDHSQYDYYKVYLSDTVIAFIPDDFGTLKERIEITSTYSFIAELIMFQNTALARMNNKVSDLLYRNSKVTMEEVTVLEQEYGKSIPFWEPSNFSYMGTAAEASCIKEAFSNEELLNTYNKHQDYLEHMVDLMASERENRNSMVLNIAATVLAVIQVESFITDLLMGFYKGSGIRVAAEYRSFEKSFSHTLLGGLLLIVIYLIIKNNRRKKERKLRERKTGN